MPAARSSHLVLTAPGQPVAPLAPGLHALAPGHRAPQLLVPDAPGPRPLLVGFHGAGGAPDQAVEVFAAACEATGTALLAVGSEGATWDLIRRGTFGPDVDAVEAALAAAADSVPVDPARIVLGGFSDGASYALSLGLGNGDVVAAVVACSPGFLAPDAIVGTLRVFVSHGTDDRVLPIDRCGRRVVGELRAGGYEVRYAEFEGGHVVPPDLVLDGVRWATAG